MQRIFEVPMPILKVNTTFIQIENEKMSKMQGLKKNSCNLLIGTNTTVAQSSMNNGCRILKSSFNNRQRRIESLRSFSNLFLNCSTTTPLNTCTRSTRRGIGGASTKICNSGRKDKSNNSEAVGVRCAKKRGSVLILLLRGVS